jgi:hypothetical protein
MDANPESLPTFLIGISLFKQALPCLKKHQTLLELCFRNGRFLTEHMKWKWINTDYLNECRAWRILCLHRGGGQTDNAICTS